MKINKISAEELNIEPGYVKGLEKNGLLYFLWDENPCVGAQCSNCNTILWTNSRKNFILNEEKPSNIPDSGPAYRNYYQKKLARFLSSLPSCPECNLGHYDKFINNVEFPRFPNGAEFLSNGMEKIIPSKNQVLVWYAE